MNVDVGMDRDVDLNMDVDLNIDMYFTSFHEITKAYNFTEPMVQRFQIKGLKRHESTNVLKPKAKY